MVDKSRGFCLYKNGSILRMVEDESEMQTIFSKVLMAFEEKQRERYGEPMEASNGGNSSASLSATSRNALLERAAARVSPENFDSLDATAEATEASRKGNGKRKLIQASSGSNASPPESSTRRSRRQSSRLGSQNGDEGLMSLTYSYGSMDWDAIEMCWKPKRRKRGLSRSSSSRSSKTKGSSSDSQPTKKAHADPAPEIGAHVSYA